MSWKDDFNKSFDFVLKLVEEKYWNVKFPCYGGGFFWFLVTRRFQELYFYLTDDSLLYTYSGSYVTAIPYESIRKLSIKQGRFLKSSFHVRIVADKKYHFIIKKSDYLSTKLTGTGADNVDGFIDTLRSKVENCKNKRVRNR